MNNESTLLALLSGVEFDDPRLYSLLDLLIRDFYTLENQVNPPSVVSEEDITKKVPVPLDTQGFTATVFPNNIRLTWTIIAGLASFEIRYLQGSHVASEWDDASLLARTSTFQFDVDPVSLPAVYGVHTFFIKTFDTFGNESGTASITTVTIPTISLPIITPVVLGNNVLLYWNTPLNSTFAIAYYNVYRDGGFLGREGGTFKAIFELIGGNYTYSVEAVDIVGNISPRTSVVVTVKNPEDFSFYDERVGNLNGTYVNSRKYVGTTTNHILAIINATETWTDHYVNNAWSTPQNQIDATYPIYCQPEPTAKSGSYTEVFDFGSIISNVIVVATWATLPLAGTIATGNSTLEYSTDNANWSAPFIGTTVYATSVRYVRFKLAFDSTDRHSIALYSNIRVSLNVKRETDGGQFTALATDTNGTLVTYNKVFRKIDSITLTVEAIQPITAIYTNVTTTNFRGYTFDSTGNRITYLVSWKARGIVI